MVDFAQLGIQVNSEQAVKAASDLDKLAASGARAEKATDELKKASSDLSGDLKKEASSAKEAASAIDLEARALERQNGIRDRLIKVLSTERGQRILESQNVSRSAAAINAQSQSMQNAGMSARAYSAAMRNVPAQITDITTSLIGGQPAYLVAIQQGGQLKDMFGGIVPAARALATSLLGMINPLTITAAIVGTLGVAFYQASARTEEINLALISTGRNATYTAEGIEKLAASIDSVSGVTQGGAITAITSLATTTNLTGEALTSASAAAASWASVTGQSADTVLDKFRAIAKDPVNALTKLNETERFLTETQYQRIKALQDEGRWQEAATEAAKLYADVVAGRTREVEANLGLISTAWLNIKKASSEAWDGVVSNVNRGLVPLQRYADYLDRIGGATQKLGAGGLGALNPVVGAFAYFGGNANRGRPEVIMPGVDGEKRTPETVRNEQEQNKIKERAKALADWSATADEAASRQNTLNRLEQQGIELGQSKAQIDAVLQRQRDQWAAQDEKRTSSGQARISQANKDIESADKLIQRLRDQVSANTQLADSGEKVTQSQRIATEAKRAAEDQTKSYTSAQRQELMASAQAVEASEARAKAANDERVAKEALSRQQAAFNQQLSNRQAQNAADLMGIGRGSDATQQMQRDVAIRREYEAELQRIRDSGVAADSAAYQKMTENARTQLESQLEIERQYQSERMAGIGNWRNGMTAAFEDYTSMAANAAGQYKSLFESAFSGAEDAFVNFVMTGKLSFSDLAKSIIADLARIAAKEAIVASIKAISAAFGGGYGGGADSGVGSTQLGNNYNWGGGFSSGGYTGPGGKYQPAGTVHRGEVVWSQADVAAVGGPRRANAMRPTSGYASGGIVGGSSGMSNITNSQPNVEININMDGGTVDSQTQNGTSSQETMQLVNMIKGVVSQWYTEQSRTGGVVYRQQRGMAG